MKIESKIIEEVVALMRAERQRQIEVEGWTQEHDDAHDNGELLRAALCYYQEAQDANSYRPDGKPMGWPWEDMWWKPKTAEKNLIRAGALCLAERDRARRQHRSVENIKQKFDMVVRALAKLKLEVQTVYS